MMRLGKVIALLMMLALVVALVGCSGGTTAPPTGTTKDTPAETTEEATGEATDPDVTPSKTVVEIDFAFEPKRLEVKVGDTVTFKNEDSAPHIVSIDGTTLGNQERGVSVTWTAEKAGTFPYICTIHPSMTGEIVVK